MKGLLCAIDTAGELWFLHPGLRFGKNVHDAASMIIEPISRFIPIYRIQINTRYIGCDIESNEIDYRDISYDSTIFYISTDTDGEIMIHSVYGAVYIDGETKDLRFGENIHPQKFIFHEMGE